VSHAAAFELRGVSVRYPAGPALDGVDLRIERGEALALVGPSGAGKTTLLRLLNASARPDAGRVLVDGRDLAELADGGLREVRSRLGLIPQEHGLVPNLRVTQNVLAGRLGRRKGARGLRGVFWPRRRELLDVLALLERLGIAEKLFQRVDALSGGEQQRVAIARALYQEPAALLADEPLASLDPARAREILGLLLELARERGSTLVLSMHDLALARELVPRLVGLRRGRVLFDEPTARVDEGRFRRLYELDGGAPP
jgi:phosphonate transport system ATP-binding protein